MGTSISTGEAASCWGRQSLLRQQVQERNLKGSGMTCTGPLRPMTETASTGLVRSCCSACSAMSVVPSRSCPCTVPVGGCTLHGRGAGYFKIAQ